jgi:hypothetical protein
VELVKQGDLEGAATEFESAHRISPHPAVLYNLGQTYVSLGRPLEAVRAFKRYLAEAQQLSPMRRQEVTELVALHERRIGSLMVTLQPVDAELVLDGKGLSPEVMTSAFDIAAGAHVVLAQKDGFEPATINVVVRPRETAEVRLELQPLKTAPSPPPEVAPLTRATVVDVEEKPARADRARPVTENRGRRRTYAYAGASLGVALCAVGGVLYAVNSKRYDEYAGDSRELSYELSSRPASQRDYQRIRRLSSEAAAIQRIDYLALSSGLVGVALLGSATLLYFSAGPQGDGGQGAMLRVEGSLW